MRLLIIAIKMWGRLERIIINIKRTLETMEQFDQNIYVRYTRMEGMRKRWQQPDRIKAMNNVLYWGVSVGPVSGGCVAAGTMEQLHQWIEILSLALLAMTRHTAASITDTHAHTFTSPIQTSKIILSHRSWFSSLIIQWQEICCQLNHHVLIFDRNSIKKI